MALRQAGIVAGLATAGESVVHRLPAHVKIAATVAFAVVVVSTPARAVWAFVLDLLVLGAVIRVARVPASVVLRRLRVELPFLAFALLLPFFGASPWAAWNIAAKASLGVGAAIVLSSTTPVVELLGGLRRLHVPPVLVGIAMFMARYLDVIVGEAARMRIARLSRGDDPRWLWQARGVASSAGALFVRSYERGERVHLAMLSRGFDGSLPAVGNDRAGGRQWLTAMSAPLVALAALLGAPR